MRHLHQQRVTESGIHVLLHAHEIIEGEWHLRLEFTPPGYMSGMIQVESRFAFGGKRVEINQSSGGQKGSRKASERALSLMECFRMAASAADTLEKHEVAALALHHGERLIDRVLPPDVRYVK